MKLFPVILLWLGASVMVHAGESITLHPSGRFGEVRVYQPQAAPTSVVLFVSGDGGWNLGVIDMAQKMVARGAIVVGVDIRRYLASLAGNKSCVSLAGDFELLSHDVQKMLHLPKYLPPILAGYSSGATVVYAVLAQAPPGTFSGALSLGFCADQDFRSATLCPGTGLRYTVNHRGDYVLEADAHLQAKWIVLQGQQDVVCKPAAVDDFVASVAGAEVQRLPKVGHGFGVQKNWQGEFQQAFLQLQSVRPEVEQVVARQSGESARPDLPLVELQANPAGSAASSGQLALILSGDGGWAGLDKKMATAFAARGIPALGVDSLRYFWGGRTPEATAADLGALIQRYLAVWHKQSVNLVGYSFGADVLPFVVNRLDPAIRDRIRSVTLVAPSQSATFEIHVSNWLPGVVTPGLPLGPELARMEKMPLCLFGEGDEHTICATLPATHATQIGSGHHLGGDGDLIVDRILRFPSNGERG